MIKTFTYIIIFLLCIQKIQCHPIHVSVLNFEYTKGNKEIDLCFKVQLDDIQLAIAHNFNIALELGKPNENPQSLKYLMDYFTAAFKIQINNKYKPQLVFVSKEVTNDGVLFRFTLPLKKRVKHFLVSNLLFMDLYMDQTNLMIVAINGNEAGYKFTINNREASIKI